MAQQLYPQQPRPQQPRPQQDDRRVPDDGEVRIPAQARGPHRGDVAPRPFAHGSVDVVIPAPRTAEPSGADRTPPPPPAGARDRVRTTVLLVVALLGVVLLLCGLHAAAAVRERSAAASAPVTVPGVHDVTYTVTTARGSAVVISYSQATGAGDYTSGSATDVPSPWRLDTRVNDSYGPSVAATIVPSGTEGEADDVLTCTIVDHGRTVAQMTRSGPGASVSCLP